MEQVLKLLEKYGITAAMAIVILWMNSRLTLIEEKLYQCYEMRIMNADESTKHNTKLLAILPPEIRIKNERTEKNDK